MINIELSDIESLSPEALRATGNYLLALAGKESNAAAPVEEAPVKAVVPPPPPPVVPPAPQPVTPPPAPNPVTPPPAPICEAPAERPASEVFKKPQPVTAVAAPPAPIKAAEERPEPIKAAEERLEHPSVELDSDGLPWDSRIHSRTKSKTKDGRWKKIRGVGAEIVKRVEDELKKVQNIPAAPALSASVSSENAPTFADLMSLVTRSITNGKLTREQVIEVLKPFEIPSLPLLATRLDLIPAVVQAFKGVIDAA